MRASSSTRVDLAQKPHALPSSALLPGKHPALIRVIAVRVTLRLVVFGAHEALRG